MAKYQSYAYENKFELSILSFQFSKNQYSQVIFKLTIDERFGTDFGFKSK